MVKLSPVRKMRLRLSLISRSRAQFKNITSESRSVWHEAVVESGGTNVSIYSNTTEKKGSFDPAFLSVSSPKHFFNALARSLCSRLSASSHEILSISLKSVKAQDTLCRCTWNR